MGPIWDKQDAVGPHVGPMNFAIWTDLGQELYLGDSSGRIIIIVALLHLSWNDL